MISREMTRWFLPDGTETQLGNQLPPADLVLPVRGTLPDIPESEWRPFDFRDDPRYPVKLKKQGQYGACNGHAAASGEEDSRYIAGLPHVDLSAWLPYADMCRGYDRGSSIAEALVHLTNDGTCEERFVPWGTINPARISAEARENAKRYRVEIGYRITSFREMCIACQLRMPVNFSVPVNSSFNSLDAEGRPQNRAGWHNHAVQAGFAMAKTRDGGWKVGMRNSWGEEWGAKGFCWIDERNLQGSGFDAYCLQAVESDPQRMPPVAIASAFPDVFSGYPVLT